ncbi:MAG: methyltransferase domain-containing protein [Anaerolineae bacterium]|nr:methyltransferase domain-containing protein [Anaerolineae bacterium]MEA5078732.1 methyltransferase domain-containing protein [Anaerolineaceae bacterium]
MKALKVLVKFLLILVGIGLIWRWLSRNRSLPCPTWLASMLDSRWSDRLLGTQTTLDRIGLRPGQRVLEIGPGPGRLLIPTAKRVLPGGEVFGLDIQLGMIEKLKTHAARVGASNLTMILGDATQPNVPPESFDVVYLCTVLGEIPDREAALRQCYILLKPGGRLSITEIFPDPHYQSRATVQRLAEAADFRLQATHGSWYFFTANFIKA